MSAPTIEFIEISSSSDVVGTSWDSGSDSLIADQSSVTSRYCRKWVQSLKRVPSVDMMSDPNSEFQSQGEIEEWDSEVEVEDLIEVEKMAGNLNDHKILDDLPSLGNNYDGPVHIPKPQQAEARAPLIYPTSCIRTTARPPSRYPSFNHVEYEPRTPEPSDWR
ncbi:hypothetical protein FS749_002818 [Ceratobasidium sp. UAMH 11750]|nr:hypothetical protein FS749_002818 [Ceratobasidium sp. UAMH 11750]